jgi:hypothetical protein
VFRRQGENYRRFIWPSTDSSDASSEHCKEPSVADCAVVPLGERLVASFEGPLLHGVIFSPTGLHIEQYIPDKISPRIVLCSCSTR